MSHNSARPRHSSPSLSSSYWSDSLLLSRFSLMLCRLSTTPGLAGLVPTSPATSTSSDRPLMVGMGGELDLTAPPAGGAGGSSLGLCRLTLLLFSLLLFFLFLFLGLTFLFLLFWLSYNRNEYMVST